MNGQQLADAAKDRAEKFESMGGPPATDQDLAIYVEEIYHEHDLNDEQMHEATTILFMKEALSLDKGEQKVLKQLLLVAWGHSNCLSFQEHLGVEGPEWNEEWLTDVITTMSEKVSITPEETW